MNTALTLYCALIIISDTNCFYVQNTSDHKDFDRQAVILRKLQNLQERDSRNSTQTTTWSEILADVLVKEMFSYKKVDTIKHISKPPEETTSFLVKAVSRVLEAYKIYVFDKMRSNYSETKVNKGTDDTTSKIGIIKNETEAMSNPNDDVEIIEPKYHGKLQGNGSLEFPDSVSDCGDGLIRDEDGNCVEPKHSKFVLSVPWQCPIGYRPDWLGYCRVSL
ncbi:uncharacterized protein LOC120626902 [Pararge aegeria]|uniref:Jg19889 protein n=1 Tax=Pararge aegeria aegeria TaxID=348720 RepID=A0A8S4SFQ2_9NEOP|nr:uncharacterized protein LOC120626902 [Pararge aegeria]CAH2266885.1 jg19889 [Pararge aegeria aegeria]